MKIKTIIKRTVIGIIVFFVVMLVFGIILQKTGYQPAIKTKSESYKQAIEADTREVGTQIVESEQPNAPSMQNAIAYMPIDPARTDIDNTTIKYSIAPLIPVHFGKVLRYRQSIVVYQRLTKEQLLKLANIIYEDTKRKSDFNALQIMFTDHEQFLEIAPARLGTVNYAPNGKWEDAQKVKTGNYKKMKPDSHLFEPNWENALTEHEAEICSTYTKLERKYIADGIDDVMGKAQAEIGKKYDMLPDDVFILIMKYGRGYDLNSE